MYVLTQVSRTSDTPPRNAMCYGTHSQIIRLRPCVLLVYVRAPIFFLYWGIGGVMSVAIARRGKVAMNDEKSTQKNSRGEKEAQM